MSGYYSPILTTLPQKDISGIMTSFWHFDGSKDKWAVLAKAYTLIRDLKGKTDAPLNIFLKFNAPRAGILNPDDYITKLGWEIVTGPNGGPQLLRDTANDAVDVAASLASHVSIQDILNNSVQHGYITKHDLSALYKQQDDEVFNLATSNMAVRPVATLSDGKAKLGIYDRTFLDRILTEITAANRPFRNTVIPSENLFLTFDPFTVQAFDAFDMGEKMPDEIVTTFDINDWVEFN